MLTHLLKALKGPKIEYSMMKQFSPIFAAQLPSQPPIESSKNYQFLRWSKKTCGERFLSVK